MRFAKTRNKLQFKTISRNQPHKLPKVHLAASHVHFIQAGGRFPVSVVESGHLMKYGPGQVAEIHKDLLKLWVAKQTIYLDLRSPLLVDANLL